ncbi:MAG: DNA polymerase I [Planctomycetes bacterium]|nr:DNA polymerase I [Planctomycetota bacterium]
MTARLPFPEKPLPAAEPSRPGRSRKGRVFLLDGTALAYRSHYALIRTPLTSSRGQNVSALFVFANTLFRILEQEHPDFLAVAFDPKGKTFRHERYEAYKATREKTPQELIDLFPALRDLVAGFRAPIVEVAGYEADDVIATLAVQAAGAGHEVLIVTGDKDFLQIVSQGIKLYNILRPDKDVEIQGEEAARAKFGVPPEQVVDVLALMGDSSDNVPGVAGVGPKTATQLVAALGGLDEIYAHLDQVERPQLREKLAQERASAFLSRELVTLDLAAPVTFDLETFRCRGPDPARLGPLFRAFEMDSLLRRISVDQSHDEHTYRIVRDLETWERFRAELKAADGFVFDTETTSLDPLRARLVGISVSFREREAYYLPANLEPPLFGGARPDLEHFLEALAGPLADAAVGKRAQNAKYDLLVLRRHGADVRGVDFDTMLASYCVSPGDLQHNLDHLALKYLNFKKVATSELIGRGRKQITMDQVDVERVGNYSCEDVDVTGRLIPLLRREMERAGVAPLFATVEMPLMRVLADMEEAGVALDVSLLAEISADLGQRVAALTARIHELAGEAFNINSPKQLGAILFDKLGVHQQVGARKPRRTKTGYSTDASVLEEYGRHPLVAALLEYRGLVKLKGTYVDALPELVNPATGRIHTSYNQAVAATGRLSSSDPNLQNIPVRSEDGQRIRRAFVPGAPGRVLLSADYSQVELRIMAHLSADPQLLRAFRAGEDVHRRTASLIFGMPVQQVPPDLRARAKTINFGVIYGMGPQRLAAATKMTVKEATEFIAAYFRTFSGVKRYLDETLARARQDGYVTTLLGRRRYIGELDSPHARVAAAARNVAVNTPIQGTAADLIKVAMIRLHQRLIERGLASRMILQVHDELVLEAPEAEVEVLKPLVAETMQGALDLSVPLVVDVGVGRNWLEAH